MAELSDDEANVKVLISSVSATKIEATHDQQQPIIFNMNVKLEEVEQSSDRAVVHFGLNINTQPHLAKFSVDGLATVEAKPAAMDRLFVTDPATQVPRIVNRVYKDIYTTVFLLASVIKVPAPSPGLLHTQKPPVTMESHPAEADVPAPAASTKTADVTSQTLEVASQTSEKEPAYRSEYPSQPYRE